MLELEDLLIRLGTFELRASMALKEGRRYAVIGPSGAGKSTLFELLQRFYDVSSGQIKLHNKELSTLSLHARCPTRCWSGCATRRRCGASRLSTSSICSFCRSRRPRTASTSRLR